MTEFAQGFITWEVIETGTYGEFELRRAPYNNYNPWPEQSKSKYAITLLYL